jgi:hypothetical protein
MHMHTQTSASVLVLEAADDVTQVSCFLLFLSWSF